jgi:hypothetical protein
MKRASVVSARCASGCTYLYNEASLLRLLSFLGVKTRHARQIVDEALDWLNAHAQPVPELEACHGSDVRHQANVAPCTTSGPAAAPLADAAKLPNHHASEDLDAIKVTVDAAPAPSRKLHIMWCAARAGHLCCSSTAGWCCDLIDRAIARRTVCKSQGVPCCHSSTSQAQSCRPSLKVVLVATAGAYCQMQPADVQLAASVLQRQRGIIVLLCGAAGTGKSTLSSLLGQRLGIVNVLSTDSIRHSMRCDARAASVCAPHMHGIAH